MLVPMAIRLFLVFVFVSIFTCPIISAYSPAQVKSMCGKTPHPKPCEHFLSQNANYGPIRNDPDFLKATVKLALDRAMHANSNTKSLGSKCRNKLEKTAWSDCVELYEHTILKLNTTIDPYRKCSQVEAQTWLSAALTNLETCRAGFLELGITDHVLPLMENNVSMLISNTLAINKGTKFSKPTYKGKFPTWVSPGDRKLLQVPSPGAGANIVVAQDGSGNFKTVGEGVAAAKPTGSGRFVIYVKAGIYQENVQIGSKLQNIMLVGDGIGRTIITSSKSVGGGASLLGSATVGVVGDGFIGRGITFRNTAGSQNKQAVALRSGSDLSVFYQCSFEGYQDTLFVFSQRQFYRDCDIYGTVDFIFGNAAAVFQNCNIRPRKSPHGINIITAQGRTDSNQNTGIVIHNCRVTAADTAQGSVKTYLGRPWKQYSRTVFIKTFLDGFIRPEGWLPWDGNFAVNTLFYAEYLNMGPGSSTANRVKWKGYHVLTSAIEASPFTVGTFISGNSWLPATKVPFIAGV